VPKPRQDFRIVMPEKARPQHRDVLLLVVQRDNADTDQLHARNALQSSGAGSVGPVDRCNPG
jgi:hypothetical protein